MISTPGYSKNGKKLGRPPGSRNKSYHVARVRTPQRYPRLPPAPLETFAENLAKSFARGLVRGLNVPARGF